MSDIASTAGQGIDWLTGAVTGGVNAWTNYQNYKLSKDAYNYNKSQTEWERQQYLKSLEREDTAVQRRTADLKAAGINPILAAGQSAQTMAPISPNHVDAPHIGNMPDAPQLLPLMELAQRIRLIGSQKEQTDAEASEAKARAEGQDKANQKFDEIFGWRRNQEKRDANADIRASRADSRAHAEAEREAAREKAEIPRREARWDQEKERMKREFRTSDREWEAIKDLPFFLGQDKSWNKLRESSQMEGDKDRRVTDWTIFLEWLFGREK